MEMVNKKEEERSETIPIVKENPYQTAPGVCCPFSLTGSVMTFCVTKNINSRRTLILTPSSVVFITN